MAKYTRCSHKSASRGFYPRGNGIGTKYGGSVGALCCPLEEAHMTPQRHCPFCRPRTHGPAPTGACPTEFMPLAVIFACLSVHRCSFVGDLCVVCAYGMDVCPHSPACGQKPPQLPKRVCPIEQMPTGGTSVSLGHYLSTSSAILCVVCLHGAGDW
jgi:hypothetical protein